MNPQQDQPLQDNEPQPTDSTSPVSPQFEYQPAGHADDQSQRAQQPQPYPAAQPLVGAAQSVATPVATPTPGPSTALSVVALILSIIAGVIGLVMSIIIFIKSKSAGVTNGLALAGIIIGSFTTVINIFVGIALVSEFTYMIEKCEKTSLSTYIDESGKSRPCLTNIGKAGFVPNSGTDGEPANKPSVDIEGTTVGMVGGKVDSICWTFSMPATGYVLNEKSADCSGAVVIDNGTGRGDELGAVTVKPQTGEISLDAIRASVDKMEKSGAKVHSVSELKINGNDAVKVVSDDWMNLKSDMYIIIDTSGKYSYRGKAITSYMVTGHSYNEVLSTVTTDAVMSFKIK